MKNVRAEDGEEGMRQVRQVKRAKIDQITVSLLPANVRGTS